MKRLAALATRQVFMQSSKRGCFLRCLPMRQFAIITDSSNLPPKAKCDKHAKDQSEAAAMEGAKDFMEQARSIIDEIQEVNEF